MILDETTERVSALVDELGDGEGVREALAVAVHPLAVAAELGIVGRQELVAAGIENEVAIACPEPRAPRPPSGQAKKVIAVPGPPTSSPK